VFPLGGSLNAKVHRRSYHAFLSYSHTNAEFVAKLHAWLTDSAGFAIWLDKTSLAAGADVDNQLATDIARCRGIVLVLSKESLRSDWVKGEIQCALKERQSSGGEFSVVAIRIDDCDVPLQLQSTKYIDAPGSELTSDVALQVVDALYPSSSDADAENWRDIYVSAPWSANAFCDLVFKGLADEGFRLIGDAKDQPGGDKFEPRVRDLLKTCGAMVAVLPGGEEPQYILRELGWARELGLPTLAVAEPEASLPPEPAKEAIRVATDAAGGAELARAVEGLYRRFRAPERGYYYFYATGMGDEDGETTRNVQRIVRRVTSLPCIVGNNLRTGAVPDVILEQIRGARAVIANLGDGTDVGDARGGYNVNSCIEAGMAKGAGVPVYPVAGGERRRAPFMLREEIKHYGGALDLLGKVHDLVAPDRRRVINAERRRRP
jgi:TIR domain